jgi:hypothetical protein
MKYRRATIVADDWHGEFGSYDEWARLGPQPRTGLLPFLKGNLPSNLCDALPDPNLGKAGPIDLHRRHRPEPHGEPARTALWGSRSGAGHTNGRRAAG